MYCRTFGRTPKSASRWRNTGLVQDTSVCGGMVANRFGLLVLCFSDWFFVASEVTRRICEVLFTFKKQWKREASDFLNFHQPPNTLHIHSSDRERMWPEAHCHVRDFRSFSTMELLKDREFLTVVSVKPATVIRRPAPPT